jgi:hypothetical protein
MGCLLLHHVSLCCAMCLASGTLLSGPLLWVWLLCIYPSLCGHSRLALVTYRVPACLLWSVVRGTLLVIVSLVCGSIVVLWVCVLWRWVRRLAGISLGMWLVYLPTRFLSLCLLCWWTASWLLFPFRGCARFRLCIARAIP